MYVWKYIDIYIYLCIDSVHIYIYIYTYNYICVDMYVTQSVHIAICNIYRKYIYIYYIHIIYIYICIYPISAWPQDVLGICSRSWKKNKLEQYHGTPLNLQIAVNSVFSFYWSGCIQIDILSAWAERMELLEANSPWAMWRKNTFLTLRPSR